MIIENICAQPQSLIYGAAGLVGAGLMAAKTIYEKKQEHGKDFKFSVPKVLDTLWQSVLAGMAAGSTMGCSYAALLTVGVAGYGADKVANKLKPYGITPANLIDNLAKLMFSADQQVSKKKKSKTKKK